MNAALVPWKDDRGMSTAEYAVGTCGAIGFAGILLKIITSPEIIEVIKNLILDLLQKFVGG
ncbi:MAG: DUF4244 domain-containing protein [Candidatus Nanopelagicales bacterium]